MVVSVGIIKNQANLDLDYFEDSNADVDANFVICESGKIAEIQVTGEEYFFSTEQFEELFNLAKYGVSTIIKNKRNFIIIKRKEVIFFSNNKNKIFEIQNMFSNLEIKLKLE